MLGQFLPQQLIIIKAQGIGNLIGRHQIETIVHKIKIRGHKFFIGSIVYRNKVLQMIVLGIFKYIV